MSPGQRDTTWFESKVNKYHRPASEILNAIVRSGLIIEQVGEPLPSREAVEAYPSLASEVHKPSFLIVRAKKGPAAATER